jgi:CO/xanthine dehydrogenase FAD-binding subunit
MGKVYLPGSLQAVFDIVSGEPQAALYAGGTDLFVKSPPGKRDDRPLVCLERIGELKGIGDLGDEVRIGACTTHSELIASRLIGEYFPLLKRAAAHVGAPAIRNMGTVGGNICTASPAGDTLPPLYIYSAEVELRSGNRVRRLPLSSFIQGPGQTMLDKGEVLSAVYIGKGHGYTFCHFEKAGQRRAMAISVASFAFAAALSEDGSVDQARCAFGSVAPTVLTMEALDDCLTGRHIDERTLRQAAALVSEGVSPISDVRASKEYRRAVAGNLVMRLASSLQVVR